MRARQIRERCSIRHRYTGNEVVQAVYRREDIRAARYLEISPYCSMPTRLEDLGFGEHEFCSDKHHPAMEAAFSGHDYWYGRFVADGENVPLAQRWTAFFGVDPVDHLQSPMNSLRRHGRPVFAEVITFFVPLETCSGSDWQGAMSIEWRRVNR